MVNLISNTGDVVYYVVRINGVEISPKFENKILAESHKMNLDLEQRRVAQIVPVTADGKELLLG